MVFANLTVMENLMMGAYLQRDKQVIAKELEYVFSVFPRLKEREKQLAGTLSGGEQQMLAIGRALMGKPRFLMLDEPAGGLNHSEVDDLAQLLQRIRAHFDLSILLVEHHMNLVMRVSHKVVALEFGLKIADGTPDEVRAEPEVIRAYLGETQEEQHAGAA